MSEGARSPASPATARPGAGSDEPATRAVRAELRAALSDLSETLLEGSRPELHRLNDALVHTWILTDLADLEEAEQSLVRGVLRGLQRDLDADPHSLDLGYHAHRLAGAADRC